VCLKYLWGKIVLNPHEHLYSIIIFILPIGLGTETSGQSLRPFEFIPTRPDCLSSVCLKLCYPLADLFSFSKPGVPNKKMPPRTGMEESEEAN
jgi:hypothetical protein